MALFTERSHLSELLIVRKGVLCTHGLRSYEHVCSPVSTTAMSCGAGGRGGGAAWGYGFQFSVLSGPATVVRVLRSGRFWQYRRIF